MVTCCFCFFNKTRINGIIPGHISIIVLLCTQECSKKDWTAVQWDATKAAWWLPSQWAVEIRWRWRIVCNCYDDSNHNRTCTACWLRSFNSARNRGRIVAIDHFWFLTHDSRFLRRSNSEAEREVHLEFDELTSELSSWGWYIHFSRHATNRHPFHIGFQKCKIVLEIRSFESTST